MRLTLLLRIRDYILAILLRIWHLLLWHSRLVLRLLLAGALCLLILACAWQFWFIPRLEAYRPALVAEFSRMTGMKIDVGAIEGGWEGLRPALVLKNLRAYNQAGESALSFSRLEGALSWWALPLGKLHFSHLQLVAPELQVVHLLDGRWQVAGVVLEQGGSKGNSGFINWLLEQRSLSITGGRLLLQDQRQTSPALELSKFDFNASNFFGHRKIDFGVTPPAGLGQRITGNGVLIGDNIDRLDTWSGKVNLLLAGIDLPKWHERVVEFIPETVATYPVVRQGVGNLTLTLAFDSKVINKLDADLVLGKLQLMRDDQLFELPKLDALAHWEVVKGRESLVVEARNIDGVSGPLARNGRLEYSSINQDRQLHVRGVTLGGLSSYSALLPQAWAAKLAGATLVGEVVNLQLAWRGDWHKPVSWNGEGEVRGLELAAPQWLPHLGKLDATANFDDKKGSVTLRSQALRLDYPAQFVEPLVLNRLDTSFSWNRTEAGWDISAERLAMSNAETAVNLSGRYRWTGKELGDIDLKGDIVRLPANRAYVYLPRVIGDDTLAWLKDSLRAGRASNGKVELRGELAHFPFEDGSGLFRITAQAQDVTLDYAKGWPAITGIGGELRFEGVGMTILATRGKLFDAQLKNVLTRIPDMSKHPHVLIEGKVEGGMPDYLRFVRNSPVQTATEGVLDDLKADGSGALDLSLDIPVEDTDKTKVFGRLRLQGNRLDFGSPIPVLTQATGRIEFTDTSVKIGDVSARALGGAVKVSGMSDSHGNVKLSMNGDAGLAEVAQQFSLPLAKRFGGRVGFQGDLQVGKGRYDLALQSSLAGAQVDLPAPLGKQVGEVRPLRLKINGDAQHQAIEFSYDKLLQGALNQQSDKSYAGVISLGATKAIPTSAAKGIQVIGGWHELDLNAWQAVQDGGDTGTAPLITGIDLGFERIRGWGKILNAVQVKAVPSVQGWSVQLASKQASGQVIWRGGNNPRITGKLDKLLLPLPESVSVLAKPAPATVALSSGVNPGPKPVLDLSVENFRYKELDLGKLVINATPQGDGWQLNTVTLTNPDGRFSMTGLWQGSGANEHTAAKFNLKSENTGKLLARLGYPDALRRGPTVITGEGGWVGPPFSPVLETLQGKLRIDVESGQFSKIEPGAGRLLSIISLQSLSRRIRFDFRDVFSDGLEFDSIAGDALIEKGVLHTDNLLIKSSAASVGFKGDANLVAGTQDIHVHIVPQVSDAASLAAVVVNPLAGAAAFALQRLLKDPLGQLISYEYEITGDMLDPQVRKVR